jgi:hypothetical protein
LLTIERKNSFLEILQEELIPAMGCTEPIALAYAAAKAREILGAAPERMCKFPILAGWLVLRLQWLWVLLAVMRIGKWKF